MNEDPLESARTLVGLLRKPGMNCRTGILLVDLKQVASLDDIAAKLNVDHVDYRELLLQGVSPDARFLGLDKVKAFAEIDSASSFNESLDCALVSNFDVAIAKLECGDRGMLWGKLLNGLPHRPRAIIFVIPKTAKSLLPNTIDEWRMYGRVAEV